MLEKSAELQFYAIALIFNELPDRRDQLTYLLKAPAFMLKNKF